MFRLPCFVLLFALVFQIPVVHGRYMECVPGIAAAAQEAGTWHGAETENQRLAIQRALTRFKEDGTLLIGRNATEITGFCYPRLFSIGDWAANREKDASGVFESREHFWVVFDLAVQQALRMEEQRPAQDREADLENERTPYSRLKTFNFLRIPMPVSSKLDPKVLAYLRLRSEQIFGQSIRLAVTALEKEGVLINPRNARAIVGMTYDQLMGTDYYGVSPEGKAKVKKVTPRIVEFWRSFAQEVASRIESGSTSPHLLGFSVFDVAFEVAQGPAYYKEVTRLFDENRSAEQARFLNMAIDIFGRTGVRFTPKATSYYGGATWVRITGRDDYARGGGQHHRRVFDNPVAFWLAFAEAADKVRQDWPNSAPPDLDEGGRRIYHENLERFSLYTLRFEDIPYGYRQKWAHRCEWDRKKDQALYTRLLVDYAQSEGVFPSRKEAERILDFSWDRLVGKGRYAETMPHLSVFRTPEAFESSFRKEIGRRFSCAIPPEGYLNLRRLGSGDRLSVSAEIGKLKAHYLSLIPPLQHERGGFVLVRFRSNAGELRTGFIEKALERNITVLDIGGSTSLTLDRNVIFPIGRDSIRLIYNRPIPSYVGNENPSGVYREFLDLMVAYTSTPDFQKLSRLNQVNQLADSVAALFPLWNGSTKAPQENAAGTMTSVQVNSVLADVLRETGFCAFLRCDSAESLSIYVPLGEYNATEWYVVDALRTAKVVPDSERWADSENVLGKWRDNRNYLQSLE